jgi:molybdenum cofactor cytidylyltransferase
LRADVRGVLLCGGASSRFGSDKLLAPVGDDSRPMAEASARHLLEGTQRVLAVIPCGAAALRAILEPLGCEIVESDRTALGIGASIAAGVRASRDASGWIVALGDMPAIEPATIAAVRAALEAGAGIAVPVDAASGERGHPVGFGRAFAAELAALASDEGARSVLAAHGDQITRIPVSDRGIFLDIDTPADLRAPDMRKRKAIP